MPRIIHPGNLETFFEEYEKQLRAAITAQPEKYAYSLDKLPDVLTRMRGAFDRGTYTHDTPAIRATCRALGIKPTRTEIEKFISL